MAKILIVDDEPNVTKMLGIRLEKNNYQVVTAGDGEEGVAKAKSENPDLIIMDVMMPRLNGLEATRRIKSDPLTKDIPVLMLTVLGRQEDELQGRICGASYFITKPYEPTALLGLIKNALADAKSRKGHGFFT